MNRGAFLVIALGALAFIFARRAKAATSTAGVNAAPGLGLTVGGWTESGTDMGSDTFWAGPQDGTMWGVPFAPTQGGMTGMPFIGAGDLTGLIQSELTRQGAPFTVADILAVIQVESSFNPQAVSPAPAYGLMQMTMPAARDRGYSGSAQGLFDPAVNIRLGISHLLWTKKYIEQRVLNRAADWREILSAYNAGVGNFRKGFRADDYAQKFTEYRAGFQQAGIA